MVDLTKVDAPKETLNTLERTWIFPTTGQETKCEITKLAEEIAEIHKVATIGYTYPDQSQIGA